MAMKGFFLSICLLLSSPFYPAAGQTDTDNTLDLLITAALQHNPELHKLEYASQAAKYKAQSSGALPDPQISFAAVNLPKSSLSFDETPMSGLVIGFSQAIPWPSYLKNQSNIAGLEYDSRNVKTEILKNRIVREVKSSYYEYSYWTLAEIILGENLELIETLIQSADTRYSTGIGTARDLLKGQTTRARLNNRILLVNQQKTKALNQLIRLTDNILQLDQTLPARIPDSMAEISSSEINNLIANNPLYQEAGLNSDIAEKHISLERSRYWPNLMLGVDYRLRENVPGDPVEGENFISFKLGFSVPLWFFKKQRNQTRAARAMLVSARYQENAVHRQIEQLLDDIETALETYRASLAQYNESIIPQAQASMETAQVAYEVGKVDFDALLSSQLELLEIELERLNLLKLYHQKIAELYELLGNKVEVQS